jgi:serine/threonine protein kinase
MPKQHGAAQQEGAASAQAVLACLPADRASSGVTGGALPLPPLPLHQSPPTSAAAAAEEGPLDSIQQQLQGSSQVLIDLKAFAKGDRPAVADLLAVVEGKAPLHVMEKWGAACIAQACTPPLTLSVSPEQPGGAAPSSARQLPPQEQPAGPSRALGVRTTSIGLRATASAAAATRGAADAFKAAAAIDGGGYSAASAVYSAATAPLAEGAAANPGSRPRPPAASVSATVSDPPSAAASLGAAAVDVPPAATPGAPTAATTPAAPAGEAQPKGHDEGAGSGAVDAVGEDATYTGPILFKQGQQLTIVVTTTGLEPLKPRVHVLVEVLGGLGCGGMAEVLRVLVKSVESSEPGNRGGLSDEVQPGRVFALKVMYRYRDLPREWAPADPSIWTDQVETQVMFEWKALCKLRGSEHVLRGHTLGTVVPGAHHPPQRAGNRSNRSSSSSHNSSSEDEEEEEEDEEEEGAPLTACHADLQRHCLVLEVAEGGSLGKHMAALGNKGLPEENVQVVAGRVARGLAATAAVPAIHRDSKPDNVVCLHLLPDGTPDLSSAVVADFGLAKLLGRGAQEGRSMVGTPAYATPDIQPGRTHTSQVDVILLGYTTLHLLTGEPPFWYLGDPSVDPRAVARRTPEELTNPESLYMRRGCWDSPLGQQCLAFLQQAIRVDPNQRPSMQELLETSPYLQGTAPAQQDNPGSSSSSYEDRGPAAGSSGSGPPPGSSGSGPAAGSSDSGPPPGSSGSGPAAGSSDSGPPPGSSGSGPAAGSSDSGPSGGAPVSSPSSMVQQPAGVKPPGTTGASELHSQQHQQQQQQQAVQGYAEEPTGTHEMMPGAAAAGAASSSPSAPSGSHFGATGAGGDSPAAAAATGAAKHEFKTTGGGATPSPFSTTAAAGSAGALTGPLAGGNAAGMAPSQLPGSIAAAGSHHDNSSSSSGCIGNNRGSSSMHADLDSALAAAGGAGQSQAPAPAAAAALGPLPASAELAASEVEGKCMA